MAPPPALLSPDWTQVYFQHQQKSIPRVSPLFLDRSVSTSIPSSHSLLFLAPWPNRVEKLPALYCSPPFSLAYFPEQQHQDPDPGSLLSLLLRGSPRTSSLLDPTDPRQQFLTLEIPADLLLLLQPSSPCGLCSLTLLLLTQSLFHR